MSGLLVRVVAAKQAVENAARVVFRRDRPAVNVVGDGSRTRKETGAGVDGQDQRRLAAVLLGVLRDDLIETDGVERAGLRIVQRGAGEPHVRADVRIGFRTVRVLQAAHEAQLLAERSERFC